MDGSGNERRNIMYHYEYVSKKIAKPYREEFLDIIHEIQDLLRDRFTFKYKFVGSSSRNMITCDFTTNKGFDFDVNLCVNDERKSTVNGIEYSCDFCIVFEYEDKKGNRRQQYIRHQKQQQNYVWVDQPKTYQLEDKVKWIKENNLWNDVLELYCYKKNTNQNQDKKSRALYAETIHEICQKNGYAIKK